MAGLRDLINDPAASWRALNQSQRIALMVGAAILVSAAIVTYLWASAPTYVPLYTGLSARSGGNVVSTLDKMNIPYRVENNGSVIEVPRAQASSLRLKLAAKGLPGSGQVSFQDLSNEPLGTSEFVQRVQYQRALSSALAHTIESLSAVAAAKVSLAIPPHPVFLDDTRKPTASVLVTLRTGQSLGSTQVTGIQHLVASAVVGLSDKNVSVVDQSGALLSGAGQSQLGAGPEQLSYKEAVERRLKHQIAQLLTPIVGEGHIRVSVAADINYAKAKQASVVYGKSHVLSQQYRLGGHGAQGVFGIPGAVSHTPPGSASAPLHLARQLLGGKTRGKRTKAAGGRTALTPARMRNISRTVNYQNDRTVTEQVIPPGAIKRLSVAVLIDGHPAKKGKGKSSKGAVTAGEIARISSLVKNSVGFNASRGDSVSVVAMPFARKATVSAPKQAWWRSPLVPVAARYGGGLIALALLWFFLIRPILNATLGKLNPDKGDDDGSPKEVVVDGEMLEARQEAERIARSEATLAMRLQEAHEVVDTHPGMAAKVIRSWMQDA